MKHKTIKKSIIIIMICTLLFSSVSIFAASIATENMTVSVNNQYVVSPDNIYSYDNGQTYYAVYKFTVQMDISVSGVGYYNGSLLFNMQFPTSNTYTIRSVNTVVKNYENIGNDSDFFGAARYYGPNVLKTRVLMYFNNWYARQTIQPGPELEIECIVSSASDNFVPLAFTFSMSDAAGTVSKTDYPEVGVGLAGVIGYSVLHAINAGDFNDALDTLELLIATNNDILEDVLDELETSNVHLSDLVYYMNNVQNTRLQTIISKIQELIDMGKQDTQAQNDLNAAASQMEGAAAAMNVNKPNMNNVIPQTLADADAVAAQGTIFSWLNDSYLIAILSAMMTIALIGFVLYGKSG